MRFLLAILIIATTGLSAYSQKLFSTAGFYQIDNSTRFVESMNPAWLFVKDINGDFNDFAHKVDFDDSNWSKVSLPNGIEYLPMESSGGVNYRGAVWYRKHFELSSKYNDKRIVLHFEAIMGKSKIWVNGELVSEHFGGFLPISVEITDKLKLDKENVIAVWADNSDDPMYPPGKPQDVLDFCYFGGIYRDCWLIATNKNSYITDPNMVDKIAGGGVFVSFDKVEKNEAIINVKTDFVGSGKLSYVVRDDNGNIVKCHIKEGKLTVENPHLWSPESPYLYQLEVRLLGKKGEVLDGLMQKIGIKSIKFTHKDGFILNGEKYPKKLLGANRHQDFAEVGNALSNNLHYRDAKKLKDAGMEVIRNAHYPQDPAFMDACDELGLFVIENTPGWQFWNDAPVFKERVYSDIRNMVRRDRNRASVLLWEPILNETWYPEDFASAVNNIVKQELPNAYTASDNSARGSNNFDIMFSHPLSGGDGEHDLSKDADTAKVYFTREFGDNVDDWNSHNSPSRAARQWGEVAQLVQAIHYTQPNYNYTSIDALEKSAPYHFGGTLWHSFDHQRGYHPDPFYGGIMDAFRRPKYSYEMFKSQMTRQPMVFIASELTPFSSNNITVFTNCDAVRLRTITGDTLRVKKREGRWVVFENAWNFMDDKSFARSRKHSQSYILAEGLDSRGNVVASDKKQPSRRAYKLQIIVDTIDARVVADGGDLVVVTAQMVDAKGVIKRLNNSQVRFTVTGEGRQVGYRQPNNTIPILWGEASTIVQSTTNAGVIKIKAEVVPKGTNRPLDAQIEFNSYEPIYKLIYCKENLPTEASPKHLDNSIKFDNDKNEELLKEVEKQQEEFGEQR